VTGTAHFLGKGFRDFLAEAKADVIRSPETKAAQAQLMRGDHRLVGAVLG
jgi:hypothetical protein